MLFFYGSVSIRLNLCFSVGHWLWFERHRWRERSLASGPGERPASSAPADYGFPLSSRALRHKMCPAIRNQTAPEMGVGTAGGDV